METTKNRGLPLGKRRNQEFHCSTPGVNWLLYELTPQTWLHNLPPFFGGLQQEGSRVISRDVEYYNLDVIISVGYRVKSHRGTQFRIWATGTLREYLVKGFVMNDERLAGSEHNYFDELVERVRRIRTSEREFCRKVLDVFATSIDYETKTAQAQEFFATVQNKFHYAIHGRTAAELIAERVNSQSPAMGLTNWSGKVVTAKDARIAKNHLEEIELKRLNLLVEQFLAYAELQAVEKRPMYMQQWVNKLDDFLRFNEKAVLSLCLHFLLFSRGDSHFWK
jgi:hypothetical protein